MGDFFKCSICGNDNPLYIGFVNGKPYCRKCISFQGGEIKPSERFPKKAPIIINYELSKEQKELSDSLLVNYKNGINTLVNAVCGSGKTEIVLQSISYLIQSGERVGFAVPRRDVAIELYERFKNIFKYNHIICVYGGHHEELEGDLIVLTTHQLYRYNNYFDLLIIDEIDAFPFADNEILNAFFFRSIKRNFIMLSATPSKETIEYFSQENHEILNLNKRFHNFPLPIPQILEGGFIKQYYLLIQKVARFLKETKKIFIFTPTIEKCENTYFILKLFFKQGSFVHSKCKNREEIIQDFKSDKLKFLVTTAVLERGVTVKDLQVIIFQGDHSLYTSAALIQICGRAGRKKDAPTGEVFIIAKNTTEEMREAIYQIEKANSDL